MAAIHSERHTRLIPRFEQTSKEAAKTVHKQVLKSNASRKAADLMHGVWLGHPLHPAATDFVIGAWMFGSVLDAVAIMTKSKAIDRSADILISMGNALAVPTALSGFTDFSTAPPQSMKTAATHGMLNAGGLAMNLLSSFFRSSGDRSAGRALSAAATGALMFSAWLGGKLVYNQKVGVNKIPDAEGPAEWALAMRESDLLDGTPARVEIEGAPIMLYRSGDRISAIGAVCAHEGGPLDKGKVHDAHVTCPWHQSVYDLHNGRVVHGPSTYREPAYETRIRDGNVELRRKEVA